MKESFKKIWTDPVWSKVISVGIIGIFSYIGFLFGKYFLSESQKIFLIESFEEVLKLKISVIYVIAIFIANWIFFWLFKKHFKRGKPLYNSKQLKFMEYNSLTQPELGLLFKWVVYFDNETPSVANLTGYCTKHGETPLRLIESRCTMPDCATARRPIDYNVVKNILESEMIHKWEKLK